jgi:hypothetical protein
MVNRVGTHPEHDGPHERDVLALVKDNERFIYFFDSGNRRETDLLLQALGKQAADKALNFTWYDAAVLSQRVRAIIDQRVNDEAKKSEQDLW